MKLPFEKFAIKAADKVIFAAQLEAVMNASSKDANYLMLNFSTLYNKLKQKNVEMLFFIVRKPLQKYLDMIKLSKINPRLFQQKALQVHKLS